MGIFQQKSTPYCLARVNLRFSQEISMYLSDHTPSCRPNKNSSSYPSAKPFQNSISANPLAHTQSTTNSNLPPSVLPLAPHLLHITHGLYQATSVATQVTLYSSSRLDPTSGSSPRCSCASSRVQGLRRYSNPTNSHSLSSLFHCSQHLALVR